MNSRDGVQSIFNLFSRLTYVVSRELVMASNELTVATVTETVNQQALNSDTGRKVKGCQ
jgi:hypothetical protein